MRRVDTITYRLTDNYHIAMVGIESYDISPTFPMCSGEVPYNKEAHIKNAIRIINEQGIVQVVDNPKIINV